MCGPDQSQSLQLDYTSLCLSPLLCSPSPFLSLSNPCSFPPCLRLLHSKQNRYLHTKTKQKTISKGFLETISGIVKQTHTVELNWIKCRVKHNVLFRFLNCFLYCNTFVFMKKKKQKNFGCWIYEQIKIIWYPD